VEKAASNGLVYKLNFIVFTHKGGIVFPEKSKEELLQFVIDPVNADMIMTALREDCGTS